MDRPADPATKAAKYQYDDGSVEIVFATEEGRVLTVREYPGEESFEAAIDSATYQGRHAGVAELSPVEEFISGDETEH
jgi:hypothetical protein